MQSRVPRRTGKGRAIPSGLSCVAASVRADQQKPRGLPGFSGELQAAPGSQRERFFWLSDDKSNR